MSTMLEYDEQTAQQVEAVYTTPDVVEQRRIFRTVLALRPGERVLDIGSGPGFLASEMAQDVGRDGAISGIDFSECMLAIARQCDLDERSAPTEFQLAEARSLPFADASFDAAVSTQVYEYVDDMPAALNEAHRVLTPGGRLVVLDTDWDTIVWHTSAPERMRRVLAVWEEHLADPRLPRTLPGLLRDAGFTLADVGVIPILNWRYDPNTYSAGVLPLIARFVTGRQGVTEAEATQWAEELAGLGDRYFFSLNRYVFVARK